jgi:hypothetical protein
VPGDGDFFKKFALSVAIVVALILVVMIFCN